MSAKRKTAPKAAATQARKAAPRKAARKAAETADTVTVRVREPHLVFWRSGTLRNVDKHTAQDWARNGWADITYTPKS
jgi:uncharacterized protein YggE